MEIGLVTNCLLDRSWEEACRVAKEAGVKAIEPGCGGFIGKKHCNPKVLLNDKNEMKKFLDCALKNGLQISAMVCNGNPIHPQKKISETSLADLEESIELARRVDIKVINVHSGCPGAAEDSIYPNWITSPYPEYFEDYLNWQWNKRIIPFWREISKRAKKAGVKIAIEMLIGNSVYNPETFFRLKKEVEDEYLGINFDPAHLFWQNIDPIVAIKQLGKSIFSIHAQDCRFNKQVLEINGVIDNKSFNDFKDRAWHYSLVGTSHSYEFWHDFVTNLRMIGFDSFLNIEHLDPNIATIEGIKRAVEFMNKVILREKLGERILC